MLFSSNPMKINKLDAKISVFTPLLKDLRRLTFSRSLESPQQLSRASRVPKSSNLRAPSAIRV
jgi:hypothetical protein